MASSCFKRVQTNAHFLEILLDMIAPGQEGSGPIEESPSINKYLASKRLAVASFSASSSPLSPHHHCLFLRHADGLVYPLGSTNGHLPLTFVPRLRGIDSSEPPADSRRFTGLAPIRIILQPDGVVKCSRTHLGLCPVALATSTT